MDNLCIDLKHKKIHHEINEKLVPILKTHTGKFSVYMLNDEAMENFQKIIKNKCNENAKTTKCIQTLIEHKFSKSNDEIKSNMKILNEANARLESQNQELKELILKSLLKQEI